MATQVQIRRGTTAQNNAFVGVVGELTYDTQTNHLITHNGVAAGGFRMLKLAGDTMTGILNISTGIVLNTTGAASFGAGASAFSATGILTVGAGITLNITGAAAFGSAGQLAISVTGLISFPDGVRQIFNPSATVAGVNVGAQAGDPSTPVNGDLWYDSTGNLLRARIAGVSVSLGAAGGSSPPFADTTAIVAGSATPTKLLRFEVDGFTAATTRVLTPQDANYIIAGTNIQNNFTVGQNINGGTIQLNADGSAVFASGTVNIATNGAIDINSALVLSPDGSAFFSGGLATISDLGSISATALIVGPITQQLGAALNIQSGTDQRAGEATLVGGTIEVINSTVTADTIVLLTRRATGGTVGNVITYVRNPGTSFTINSDSALDTSTFSYFMIEVLPP